MRIRPLEIGADVPLAPSVINASQELRLVCPKSELGLVFPGRGGKLMNDSGLQPSFDEVQVAAGIINDRGKPKYHLHTLRDFFAPWD